MNVSVTEARNRLSQLLTAVEQEPVVVTRHGKAAGVLLSLTEYAKLCKLRAYHEMLQLAEELHGSGAEAQELYRISRAELDARHQ